MRLLTLLGLAVILSGCAGFPEYMQKSQECRNEWMSKIPPIYDEQTYNKSESRQAPTGRTTCTGFGNTLTCVEQMSTEYYTVPAVRTVDLNKAQREGEVRSCVRARCLEKYGNSKCRP